MNSHHGGRHTRILNLGIPQWGSAHQAVRLIPPMPLRAVQADIQEQVIHRITCPQS